MEKGEDIDSFLLNYLGQNIGKTAIKSCSPGSKEKLKQLILERYPGAIDETIAKNLFYDFLDRTAQTVPDPRKFDVLIDDISEEDLESIGRELGVVRLSIASQPVPLPVKGIFWNPNSNRMFLPLTVSPLKQSDGPRLHVLFIVDSGAPHTYLRRDTLDALFPQDTGRSVTRVLINELIMPIIVSVSHGHFENVDVLGQDFLVSGGYDLFVKYSTKEITLSK